MRQFMRPPIARPNVRRARAAAAGRSVARATAFPVGRLAGAAHSFMDGAWGASSAAIPM